MVLTEEQKTDGYETLTFENTNSSQQNAQWDNASGTSIDISSVRTGSISGFNNATSNGDYVRMIKKSTGAIGAAKLLKVMAGDRIHTYIEYYYATSNSSSSNSSASPLNSFVSGLAGAFSTTNQVGSLLKGDVSTINSQLSGNNDFTTFINPSPNTSGGNEAPKAYLNILFFDDQFKFDQASSRIVKVAYAVNSKQTIDKKFSEAVTANKSGYVYVYFSNESETSVYFDNFMLSHERSSLIEETHYYPFGLTMAGISSKAVNFGKDNRYKYNGIEKENDLEIEVYDAQLRELDAQVGRWWQVDPKIENMEMWSPYASNYDNPVKYSDPLGDEPQCCSGWGERAWGALKVVGGIAEMTAGAIGGAVTSWTGIGAVVGGAAVVHGADNVSAGLMQLFSGESTPTLTEQGISAGLQAGGVSEQKASMIAGYADAGIGIALTAGTGLLKTAAEAEKVTLYRGVNESHAGYQNATKGVASPKGGAATAAEHNAGNTSSKFTSWTTKKEVAVNYATRPSGGGVVMSKTVKASSVVKSPSAKNVVLKQSGKIVNESEVLLKGKVKNGKVENF